MSEVSRIFWFDVLVSLLLFTNEAAIPPRHLVLMKVRFKKSQVFKGIQSIIATQPHSLSLSQEWHWRKADNL